MTTSLNPETIRMIDFWCEKVPKLYSLSDDLKSRLLIELEVAKCTGLVSKSLIKELKVIRNSLENEVTNLLMLQ